MISTVYKNKIMNITIECENEYKDWDIDFAWVISTAKSVLEFYLEQKYIYNESCLKDYDFNSLSFDFLFCDSKKTHEINKQYVLTAKAKGASENRILYGHVFRNAMLIIIAGFPSLLIKMLFTGSLLIEVIFSLNGLGLLGYEAITTRDYPVVFGTLYIFALLGLVLKLISDLTYCLVDPRINFD